MAYPKTRPTPTATLTALSAAVSVDRPVGEAHAGCGFRCFGRGGWSWKSSQGFTMRRHELGVQYGGRSCQDRRPSTSEASGRGHRERFADYGHAVHQCSGWLGAGYPAVLTGRRQQMLQRAANRPVTSSTVFPSSALRRWAPTHRWIEHVPASDCALMVKCDSG